MIFHFAVGTKPYKLHAMAEHSLGIYVDFYRTLQNCPCLRKKKKKKKKRKKGKGRKKWCNSKRKSKFPFAPVTLIGKEMRHLRLREARQRNLFVI